MSGPGRIHEYPYVGGKQAALYNFDVDEHYLKDEHKDWLDQHARPILSNGGNLALLAQTSRTGRRQHNLALSERRGNEVLSFLTSRVGRVFPVQRATFAGEDHAEQQGQREGVENEWYRSVLVIAAGQRPQLPPRLPPPPPAFQLPCDYFRFEIAWLLGLNQAWALSLEGGAAREQGLVKPRYELFVSAISVAMRNHFRSVSRAEVDNMWEWYRGELSPNGPHEFIRNVNERVSRLREQRSHQGCSGGNYRPPQLERSGREVQPWELHPDLRGRQF